MIGDPHTIDLVDELEGREAYKRGERWQSSKPDLWRKGWRDAQQKHGPERRRSERETQALARTTRKIKNPNEREIDAIMCDAAKQIEEGSK